MASKVFNKFGAKRSQNLADLPDKKGALNNILDRLASGSEIFTWEDLEIIRNISVSDITTQTIEKAADVTVKLTVDGLTLPYNPLITLENRLDKAYFTTAQPFFLGGDGLTASYYDVDAITRTTSGDLSSNFIRFESNKLIRQDNFWERGNFVYDTKISPEFISGYGAVVWEGYYKPSIDGVHKLSISTTGFLKVEFDTKQESRDFSYDEATETFNYNNSTFDSSANGLSVLLDETNTTQITLGQLRTREIDLGPLEKWSAYKLKISFFIDDLTNTGIDDFSKEIDINIIRPITGLGNINYKSLFTKDYFTNYDIGDFKDYVTKSISLGGTEIGSRGTIGSTEGSFENESETTSLGDSYRNLTNINPMISAYEIPKSIDDIKTSVSGCSFADQRVDITIDNSNPNSTEGIEVGNYVIGTGIQSDTRVTNVIENESIIISKPSNAVVSDGTLHFIDHRGLVSYGEGTFNHTNNQITGVSLAFGEISQNNIAIVDESSYPGFNIEDAQNNVASVPIKGAIIKSYASTTADFYPNITGSPSDGLKNFYVYSHIGVIDKGLKNYCNGVIQKRVTADVPTSTNTDIVITLEDTTDLSALMYVHAFPTISYSSATVDGRNEYYSLVQIKSVDSATQITIEGIDNGSGGLHPVLTSGAAIADTATVVKNLVFTSTNLNKEVCFKPTDTSPPFGANSKGLVTSYNVKLMTDYSTNSGVFNTNSKLTYNALELNYNPTTDGIVEILSTDTPTISATLPLEDSEGTSFNLLLG